MNIALNILRYVKIRNQLEIIFPALGVLSPNKKTGGIL